MTIKKLDDGRYKVDLRLGGREGRRVRKWFNRKAEAIAFERYVLANANKKEWAGKHTDRRALSGLLDTWWLYYGQNLKNGTIEKRHLVKTITAIGDIPVTRLTKRVLMSHRSQRLADGISAATINRDLYRLSGMFSALIKLEEFTGQNPLHGLPSLMEKNPGMTFLSTNEIGLLLSCLTGDEKLIALLCLSTGGRWGEVSTLTPAQLINGRITFLETKNGRKRTVPVSAELEQEVKTKASGGLFKVDYEKFCIKLKSVKPDLPRGQATHVLRHTFASHFMMNGGNIIALQQILGHASIQQTMAYAHLAPDYLQHAVVLNPLKGGLDI
ncbi:TPA: tyrosine-type recombinase/integrase [Yersinia enterocolitica]|uniref:phage integrase n=1 Tax=Yersinia TaxID=629 RepID=UPI0025AA476F|nr:tyrosine-type recombinase/integrase [Yersinia rohdei]HDL6748255.1 tyrosine-type recombinase/integrase [Yersinia enterocolitica]MDN0094147.1 tyrosine-type recombinase/integrase [Yersinia rohdei]HDL8094914.1 tyrosine-type recombinase/integrase [Yersinia enterocolitica]HDL8482809.1 tyrosine-type recombinase/integrase [Yersinia enterocolitica]HDV7162396.1 tyrosine-type recombinase/integrase [Yersinia enterocolitica]